MNKNLIKKIILDNFNLEPSDFKHLDSIISEIDEEYDSFSEWDIYYAFDEKLAQKKGLVNKLLK